MAILMKLLATRIVASNFLGFSRRLMTIFCVFDLFPSSVMKFAGVSEKNATSAPEINAEHNNSTNNVIRLISWVIPIEARNKSKLGGSESKG
jgi:hypothetical protein